MTPWTECKPRQDTHDVSQDELQETSMDCTSYFSHLDANPTLEAQHILTQMHVPREIAQVILDMAHVTDTCHVMSLPYHPDHVYCSETSGLTRMCDGERCVVLVSKPIGMCGTGDSMIQSDIPKATSNEKVRLVQVY